MKFILHDYILDGVTTKELYLQELILTSSLRASWASLLIEYDHSEISRSLSTNFTKHVTRVHTIELMVAPSRQLYEAGWRSLRKRIEQTKLHLVWVAIFSVHTPLGERLLQLTSNTFQHAGWLYNLALTMTKWLFYFTSQKSFVEHFENLYFLRILGRLSPLKNVLLGTLKLNFGHLKRLYVTSLRSRFYWQYWHPSFVHNWEIF